MRKAGSPEFLGPALTKRKLEEEERLKHAGDPGGDTHPTNWGLELAWFSGFQGWTRNGDVNFPSLPIQLLTQAVTGQRTLQTLSNSTDDLESPLTLKAQGWARVRKWHLLQADRGWQGELKCERETLMPAS